MRLAPVAIAAVLAFARDAVAYSANKRSFAVNRFYGKGPLVEGSMDPIVSPGRASSHVHTVQGGNAFGLTMTDDQLLTKSTCTSSLVKNDLSNYWTPKLYFRAEDGTFKDVEMFYMNVYYFFDATTDKIEAFPPGLRMFVGDANRRTPPATGGRSILDQSDGVPSPIQWTCPRSKESESVPLYPTDSDGLHGVGIQDPGNGGSGVGFPDKNCDGYASPLRADIHFPSCYNPAAGLHDYKNNMAFPTKGKCPEGWTHVPHLFYEVYWNTPKFADQWTPGQGKQPFVLSNGDPTGYSLHADFISGWDVATLQQIIDNCDAGSAGMDKCPGLIGGLNDPSTSCNIPNAIPETISGAMKALPGNNILGQWGVDAGTPAAAPSTGSPATPQPGTSAAPAPAPSSAAPVESPKPEETPKPEESPKPESPKPEIPSSPITTKVADAVSPTGIPNTLVTSYVGHTEVSWTTVTQNGPEPTGSHSLPAISGFTYHGCFADRRSGERVLSGIKFANIGQHAVTNTKCIAYCSSKGFSLAGTEYGGQCFCGNELAVTEKVDEAKCSMACEGDDKETCGGSLTLSVYSKSAGKRALGARHMHHLRHAS